MKRFISLLLSVAMLFSITTGLNLTAYAETFTDGNFEYEVQSDDTIKITKYIGDALDGVENVEIPEQIEGKIVTAVGKGAFTADYFASSEILCSTLKLPKTVRSFSNSCFDKFYFSSYEVVEENEYFSSVDGVLFNKDKTALLCYPPNKLRNGIAEYEIPYGVTTIGENAFYHMTSNAINWIVFPETVTEIKENFLGCEFISELKFYNRNEFEIDSQIIDNLKSTGSIYGYYSSSSYQLSKSLDNWSFHALSESNGEYEYTVLEDGSVSIRNYVGAQDETAETINIPTEIDGYIVSQIDGGVFDFDCEEGNIITKTINVPKNVTVINDEAFRNCCVLENINIDENNENYCSVDGVLFSKDKKELLSYPEGKTDEVYVVPDGVEVINLIWSSFLKELVISSSVEKIGYMRGLEKLCKYIVDEGNETFSSEDGVLFNKDKTELISYPYVKSDENYTIPTSVEIVSQGAFEYNSFLKNIILSENLNRIEQFAFCVCESIENIKFNDNLEYIGAGAFQYCTNLNSALLPENLTEIGVSAFSFCISLESVNIPGSVKIIPDGMFTCCEKLNEVNISNGVEIICSSAFSQCESLTNIYIPQSVNEIQYSAFYLCYSLENIVVDENNQFYQDINGVLCNKENKVSLLCYPSGKTDEAYTIPSCVYQVERDAFSNCNMLKEITFQSNVRYIDNGCITNCVNLKDVRLESDSKVYINTYFIRDCGTDITLYGYYDYIQGYIAEQNGFKFVKIEIPEYSYAVSEDGTATLIRYNGERKSSIEIPSEIDGHMVTSISDSHMLFGDDYNTDGSINWYLKELTIPSTIKSIKYSYGTMFGDCPGLESIIVAEDNEFYSSENGVLFNKDKTELIFYPYSKKDVDYSVPEGVQLVNGSCLANNYVKNVTLPSTLQEVPDFVAYYFNDGGNEHYGNVENIFVADSNNSYGFKSIDGVLVKDNELLIYPAGKEGSVYIVPSTISSISEYAFRSNALDEIVLPETVSYISKNAFRLAIPEIITVLNPDAVFDGDASISEYCEIRGYRGSTAEEYADEYGLSFSAVDEYIYDGFVWKYNDDYSITIIRYVGEESDIVIPSMIDGNPVSYIADEAFKDNISITSVTVPNDMFAGIGSRAFENCLSLETVYIGTNIWQIYPNAFENCTSLKSINVSENNENHFSENGVLFEDKYDDFGSKLLVYPQGKTDEQYIVSDNVHSIGDWAFNGCSNLVKLVFENDSCIIPHEAIRYCPNLTIYCYKNSTAHEYAMKNEIAFELMSEYPEPDFVIGDYEYRIVEQLDNTYIVEITKYNGVESIVEVATSAKAETGETLVVSSIGPKAFKGCETITDIIIADSITSIQKSAFEDCVSLKKISINNTQTEFGNNVFAGCSEELTIASALDSTAENYANEYGINFLGVYINNEYICVYSNDELELVSYFGAVSSDMIIPSSIYISGRGDVPVTKIDAGAYKIPEIETVRFDGINSNLVIEDGAFTECENLKNVYIVDYDYAINNIKAKFGENITIHGISGTPIEECANAQGVSFVPIELFEYTSSDAGVTITKCLYSAKTIKVPMEIDGLPVIKIEPDAFYGCTGIEHVYVLSLVCDVDLNSYLNCANYIHGYENSYAEYYAERLGSNFVSIDAVFGDYEFKLPSRSAKNVYITKYNGIEPNVVIPSNIFGLPVYRISENAFAENTELESVAFADDAYQSINVEKYAFSGCTSLESFDFSKVSYIGAFSFENCQSLKEINLNGKIFGLGLGAFAGCSALENITVDETNRYLKVENGALVSNSVSLILYPAAMVDEEFAIPETYTSVASYAFSDCKNLKKLVVKNGYCKFSDNAVSANTTIYSYEGSYAVEYAMDNNIPYVIIENESPVYSFGDFDYMITESTESLNKVEIVGYHGTAPDVVIPDSFVDEEGKKCSVVSIGYKAFENCKTIKSLYCDFKLTIRSYAFSGCESLETTNIISGEINVGAFEKCPELKTAMFKWTTLADGIFGETSSECPKNLTIYGNNQSLKDYAAKYGIKYVGVLSYNGFNYYDIDNEAVIYQYTKTNEEVIIPQVLNNCPVTKICSGAFSSDTLKSVVIEYGNSDLTIENGAFTASENLTDVTVKDLSLAINGIKEKFGENITIQGYAGSEIEKCAISEGVPFKAIPLFNYTVSGKNATITGINVHIPEIVIPAEIDGYTVTAIGSSAFANSDWLEKATISEGVKNINSYAFENCYSLKEVVLPSTVSSVTNTAFSGCDLDKLYVYNPSYNVANSKIYAANIYGYKDSFADDYAKEIGSEFIELEPIIGDYRFRIENISIFTFIVIEKYVGHDENVEFPKSIFGRSQTTIGKDVYSNCNSIKSIKIPSGIKTIEVGAFANCASLENIYVDETSKYLSSKNGVLFALNGENKALVAYPQAKLEEEFTLDEQVTLIESEAISNCANLKKLVVTNTECEFGELAISNCPNLTIYGYSNSTAQSYATANDIKFVALDAIPNVKIKGASLVLYDDISVRFLVDKATADANELDGMNMVFEFDGETIKTSEYTANDKYYMFTFNHIAPNELNSIITAKFYSNINGEEILLDTYEYSVAKYCYNMLNKYPAETHPEYAELRTLLVDLLNYGTASQIYTSFNTDNLANANLTEEQRAYGTTEDLELKTVANSSYKVVENPKAQWFAKGLSLYNSVIMKFYFKAEDITNLSVKVEAYGQEWIIPSSEFKQYATGQYYVEFNKLCAGDMSENVYVTVYEGETAVSNTYLYSIESYAYAKQNDADENLANLVMAMMKYGKSAYEYAN